jgi:hypothetical protein
MKSEAEIRKRLDKLIEEEHKMDSVEQLLRGEFILLKERALAWVLEIPQKELLVMRGYSREFVEKMSK